MLKFKALKFKVLKLKLLKLQALKNRLNNEKISKAVLHSGCTIAFSFHDDRIQKPIQRLKHIFLPQIP